MPGVIDEAGVFLAAVSIEAQRRLFHQHVREADDRIERRAQFVAHRGKEPAFRRVGAFGFGARVLKRLLLALALRHIAKHGNDFAAAAGLDRGLLQGPATHFDPDELHRGLASVRTIASDTEFDRTALAERRGIAERAQVGGSIGDVNAAEQTLPMQFGNARPEQRLRGW